MAWRPLLRQGGVQDGIDLHPGRDALKRYGIETALAPRFRDPAAREAATAAGESRDDEKRRRHRR